MQRPLLLTAISLLTTASAAFAQTVTVSAPQLNFGTATELAPQTRTVTVNNPTTAPIQVAARFFGVYGQPAWSASPAQFTVAAGGQQTVTVTFAPLHNIQHNSELVFETDHLGAVAVDLVGQGQYSLSYYNSTQNLSEQALLTSLKTITSNGHHALGYNTGRDRMFMVIDNKKVNGQGATTNTLECIYTGRVITGFNSRSSAQNQNFNTEHTWPQSLFNSSDPMVSDIHHLFPTDNDANNSRSNNPFGVATTPYRNDNVNTPSHLGNNNKYEPRDPQKGRTARAMLYFVTRYQNYQNFFTSQQQVLRQWHHQFPVAQFDRKRNDDVQTAQGNRNPFVDYPQLVDRITNFVGNPSVAADSVSIYHNTSAINFGSVSGPTTYSFVIVNNGTDPLPLSAPAATVLTGQPAVVTTSVAGASPVGVGQSQVVTLTLDPAGVTGAITGSLSFQLAGAPALVVPFTANGGVAPTGLTPAADLNLSLQAYPNPATDELTVVRHVANPLLGGAGAYTVTLIDELGRTVATQTTADEVTHFDLRGLAPGLYAVRAGSLLKRVVVR